jgi:prepilin-type N-terminal cleavage/methylation domain-containing protein
MRLSCPCAGFTIVELLVVISIIVVLLALLAPALDQAIYQAELSVCGAKLRSLGGGLVNYALGSQRRYPQWPPVH